MKSFLNCFIAISVLGLSPFGSRLSAQDILPVLETDSLPKTKILHLPEIDRPSSLDLPKELSLHKFDMPRTPLNPMILGEVGGSNLSKSLATSNVLGRRLTLSGSVYEGMNSRSQWQNSMLYSIEQTLQVDYELGKKLSLELSGMIGYTSLPSTFYAYKQYEVYGGLRYGVNERLSLGGGLAAGGFMGTRYLNPNLYARYTPSENWQFGLYGGTSLIHLPSGRGYGYQSLYSGMTFKYTADQGFFVYGRGFTSRSNAPYFGWTSHPNFWTMGAGGGVGYNIPGRGPISVGVDYIYNPVTKRMEPVFSLNIVNGLIYLIEQIIQGVQ